MDNNIEVISELAAHMGAKRGAAKQAVADYYGVTFRTVTNWIGKGGIYEYGLLVEAVKQIKLGNVVRPNDDGVKYRSIKQAYHDYNGYDSMQERLTMMWFAFELIDGEKTFKHEHVQKSTGIPRSTLFKCIARLEEKGMLFRRPTEDKSGVTYWL